MSDEDKHADDAAHVGTQTSGGLRSWVRRRLFGQRTENLTTDGMSPLVTLTVGPEGGEDPEALALVHDVLPGGRCIPPRPVEEIATGGMAVVDLAHEQSLRRNVALKRLRPELRGRGPALRGFLREAQIMGQLDHPNVVPVHAIGSDEEGIFFSMKLVDGQTLEQLIDDLPDRPLDMHELYDTIDLVIKVCDALAFAHSRGVIHCDVKPSNVMIADFGQVYLMDWGVARLVGDPENHPPVITGASTEQTRATGHSLGTPAFMAPEQVLGDPRNLSERTDVFAVGALLYALLSRHPPYVGPTLFRVLELAEVANFVPLDEACPAGSCPAALVRIVHRAMSRAPEDRHASIEDLRDDLGRFLRGGPEFPKIELAEGEVLIRQGETGETAYIVESGHLEVLAHRGGTSKRVHVLGPGEVFGEVALLAASKRTATIRAVEPSTLREVDAEALSQEIDGMKPWMGALVRSLADRFRSLGAERVPATAEQMAAWCWMYVEAFGVREPGEPLSAPLRRFFELHPYAGNATKLDALVPEIEVDEAGDRIVVRNPRGLRTRVARR